MGRFLPLLPLFCFAHIPNYPDPIYTYHPDAGSTCGWLELVAYRFSLEKMSAPDVAKLVDAMVMTIPEDELERLRVGVPLRDIILKKIERDANGCSNFTARPDELAAYPWASAESPNINGNFDLENHKIMYSNYFIEVVNVYAYPQEQYHSHRKMSFFIGWGIDGCQDDYKYDGEMIHMGAPDCRNTYNSSMPKKVEVIFASTEWLHALQRWEPMSLPEAMNCPHDNAPEHCDGYLIRFQFRDDIPPRLYPSDPIGRTGAHALI